MIVKVCSHLTFAFASKFNIASMETQTQTQRMGLSPFLTFYIDAMLNFDGDVDANANGKLKLLGGVGRNKQKLLLLKISVYCWPCLQDVDGITVLLGAKGVVGLFPCEGMTIVTPKCGRN